jgi:hypothetical protein
MSPLMPEKHSKYPIRIECDSKSSATPRAGQARRRAELHSWSRSGSRCNRA